ncbi:MAG: endolytic transglycosylase MltG [Lachnospiraceae bacterium]|nr:endolytic transglycosylase MltG [Lachnospiraceae bacterium]
MNVKQLVASITELIIKVVIAVFIIMFVYDTAVKAYDFGYRVFAEQPMTTGEGRIISVYVEDGDSAKDIGENLQEKGLIRDANLFFVQELLSENHGKIKPGIYDLNTSMSSNEMIAIMATETEAAEESEESEESEVSEESEAIEEPETVEETVEETE